MHHSRPGLTPSPGEHRDEDDHAAQTLDRLLTVDEVSDYLGLSRDFVYDQVRLGKLRCSKMARQLRFRRADIDDFVDQHTIADGVRS
jgi:excisionase family DNA binding protein